MNISARIFIFFLLLITSLPGSVDAQQLKQTDNPERKSVSYGFVSPNAEDNPGLAEAIRKLNSVEEFRLIAETHRIGCLGEFKPRVMQALGSWADGAEHSTLFKTSANEPTMRYAVSSLGKYSRQKVVLYFRQSRSGDARLYIIYPSRHWRDLFALAGMLDRTGIAYRTIVPLRTRTLIYVVDLKNELRQKIPVAARALRAQVRTLSGDANFLGDDSDREKAQEIFTREMRSFESVHPEIPGKCPIQE